MSKVENGNTDGDDENKINKSSLETQIATANKLLSKEKQYSAKSWKTFAAN